MERTLGEHLSKLGGWTQRHMDFRAKKGATGYELMGYQTGLGKAAVMGAGAWVGVNDGQNITMSGESLELDSEHPLSQIAINAANAMRALNTLTTTMDEGNDHFSPEKTVHLQQGLDDIAHRAGCRILRHLYLEKTKK